MIKPKELHTLNKINDTELLLIQEPVYMNGFSVDLEIYKGGFKRNTQVYIIISNETPNYVFSKIISINDSSSL